MNAAVAISLTLLLLPSLAQAADSVAPFLKPTWDASRMREGLKQRPSDMMVAYWLMDRSHRNGIGNSDAKTSGGLGWGESSWLMDYVMCYKATRDTYWLDKVVDHFDRMMGTLNDPEGDGFLAWRDPAYSVGIVRVTGRQSAEGLTIEPETCRTHVGRGGESITGHIYAITFPAPNKVEVRDETEKKVIATKDYKDKLVLTEIPGSKFTLSGPAKPGARFALASTAGEEIEYQVHDGMITYPIAQFIEIVFKDAGLHGRYKRKADEYLAFIDKHIRQKWEATWVELPDDGGAYNFTQHVTQRFAGGLLPHNQFLALARTFIVLKDVDGVPNRAVYLDKATKMARYFKKSLRLNGDAYVWNYWDPYPPIPEVRLNVEDTSHGSIDIGFVAEACNRKVVFTDDDLRRFSNTYADVMWNKSKDDPKIAGVVDGRSSKRDGQVIREWIKLAQWNPKVWDVAMLMQAKGFSTGAAPTVLCMLSGMAGLDAAEIEAYHKGKAALEKGFAAGAPINGDFEMGGSADQAPLGWAFGVWSQSVGKCAWVEGGHQSQHAILLEGISGPVNVVAHPTIRTKVDRPTKFKLSVYYRTEGEAKPGFSFIGYDDPAAKAKQYDSAPALPKSAEWTKAEWTATSAEGVKEVYFILRNHGVGKAFYDDFRMEKVAE
ncbi:MAG: hypothetical protein FJ279_11000 [Planctomycetes bacterium]|nr:hypothetical protein [Planctomycetota bacterium]MBM4078143.1 hypothetical protein [Planctomycetota bacterium]